MLTRKEGHGACRPQSVSWSRAATAVQPVETRLCLKTTGLLEEHALVIDPRQRAAIDVPFGKELVDCLATSDEGSVVINYHEPAFDDQIE